MSDAQLPSPTSIPHLIATHMLAGQSGASLQVTDLAAVISEVQVRSQILGASYMTVSIIDPDWQVQTSGLITPDADGRLPAVEINFPEGSDQWWRLCAVNGTGDRTAANLTLTFEDRIVSYLRDHWGPKAIAPGSTTRAQLVKQLVDEVKAGGGIRFVCPSLNIVQPVASSTTTNLGQTTVSTAIDQQNASIKVNKSKGVGHGAKVTVKGQPLSKLQISEASTLIGVAAALKAGPVATEALIFAAIAESSIGGGASSYVPNSAGYYGVLQGSSQTWPDPHDTAGMANAFLLGGKGFQAGGAIALSRTVSDPIEIAVKVEVPSVWPSNAYASEAGFSQFLPEAKAIIAAAGGTTAGSQLASLDALGTAAGASDISQLTRGTADNPDEDSWDCISRLAQQVSWFAFVAGVHLYFMDGYDLIGQKPAAYIELLSSQDGTPTNGLRWQLTDAISGEKSLDIVVAPSPNYTFDNTTMTYRSTHTVKGKIQRKSRTAKPSTPSEIQINIVCDPGWGRAGDVFVFQSAGPINGRWVVTDATRNTLGDLFTQFTLEPPIAPTPEPQADANGQPVLPGSTTAGASVGGYVNPFSKVGNLSPLRIDMGVDYSGSGDVLAIGNAKVFCTAGPGWPGNVFIGYTLLDGAYAGKHVYVAEDITPSVKVGQVVTAGQKIGTMGSPSIETGWASGSGDGTLAASLNQQNPNGDPGAWMSAAGSSFNTFLVSLGCISGTTQPGGVHGKMPAGFPPAAGTLSPGTNLPVSLTGG